MSSDITEAGSPPNDPERWPAAFARRLGRYGMIGFGESNMACEWDSDDRVGVFASVAKSADESIPIALHRLRPRAGTRQ